MFKNLVFFRLADDWALPATDALEAALDAARFLPCGATQRACAGWVPPRGEQHGALVELIDGEAILKLMTETRMLPGSVVKDRLNDAVERIEQERGRKPGGKEKRELKEAIELELLPRAFTRKRQTFVWLSPKGRFLAIEGSSASKADAVVDAVVEALGAAGSVPKLTHVHTRRSPGGAMAAWLVEQEAPAGFSVDRDCELRSTDGDKATVRYARHDLGIAEVVEHIQTGGKQPTQLAMTFDGRVSFVLTHELQLKKVELVDVETEAGGDAAADEGFDADVALVTGELRRLIPALLEALGGEADTEAPATADTPSAPLPLAA